MSKVTLVPVPPDDIRDGLYSVIGGALAGGAPAPAWVAVDDGTDTWVVKVSKRPAAERMGCVVAAASEGALVTAQRLGIGGAMWLPPSSLGALEAFEAAGAAVSPVAPDAAPLELFEDSASIQIAAFADRAFWRAQLGDRALVSRLSELATALGTPASILPWPALVVANRDGSEIVEKWNELSPAGGAIGLQIFELPERGEGNLNASYGALLNGSPTIESPGTTEAQPVHELPHGRRVGWWAQEERDPEDEGWLAKLVEVTPTGCQWQISGGQLPGKVAEVLTGKEAAEVEGVAAIRIPGWASRELQSGTPAGLLATRIAEAAARRGLPLWIPGVDEEALRFVLGLPGTIWVDGPAVPD